MIKTLPIKPYFYSEKNSYRQSTTRIRVEAIHERLGCTSTLLRIIVKKKGTSCLNRQSEGALPEGRYPNVIIDCVTRHGEKKNSYRNLSWIKTMKGEKNTKSQPPTRITSSKYVRIKTKISRVDFLFRIRATLPLIIAPSHVNFRRRRRTFYASNLRNFSALARKRDMKSELKSKIM